MNHQTDVLCSPTPRSPHQRFRLGAVALVGVVALGACGSAESAPTSVTTPVPAVVETVPATKFTVVVSDPPLADLVRQVAGSEVEVVGVVPLGADGHTYEPRPEDARTLAEADIYVENGMGLNNVVSEFASSNYPSGTPHHALSEVIPERDLIATNSPEEIAAHGHAHSFNAHFWPDPIYAIAYVGRIKAILSEFDPPGAAGYSQRAASLVADLEQMHQVFGDVIATIPDANRKLVVYHDSWSYYGRRYGLPVIGAIQPVDFSEPSAAELGSTIDEVRAAGVPAFFGSEVFPSDVLEAIAQETGASYVADLSDDRLPGDVGAPEHTYVGMMVANTRIIVQSLGGDASALDAIDPATP